MATPGQLVQTMADVLGIPAATVAQYDRQLAEAGLRTVGGRGTSAAKVTATDAANLLIALLGSPVSGPSIKVAKQSCEKFGSLAVVSLFSDSRKFREFGLVSAAKLPKRHSFRDALAALIHGASQGELFRTIDGNDVLLEADLRFRVKVDSRRQMADISCYGGGQLAELFYASPEVYSSREAAIQFDLTKPDLGQERTITFRTVCLLGSLIATGRG